MTYEEIFEDILSAVSDVTGINRADIISCRSEAATDARYILVRYLSKIMPCTIIASILGRTRQGIHSILARDKGDSWLIATNWKAVVKLLESKYFISK